MNESLTPQLPQTAVFDPVSAIANLALSVSALQRDFAVLKANFDGVFNATKQLVDVSNRMWAQLNPAPVPPAQAINPSDNGTPLVPGPVVPEQPKQGAPNAA